MPPTNTDSQGREFGGYDSNRGGGHMDHNKHDSATIYGQALHFREPTQTSAYGVAINLIVPVNMLKQITIDMQNSFNSSHDDSTVLGLFSDFGILGEFVLESVFDFGLTWRRSIRSVREQSFAKLKSSMGLVAI